MKDELISRETAIRQTMGKLDYVDTIFDKPTESEIVYMLRSLPSVAAVPIEPLCRYLEVYARTPIYNMRHTAEWWKEELEKEKWEKWTVEQNA